MCKVRETWRSMASSGKLLVVQYGCGRGASFGLRDEAGEVGKVPIMSCHGHCMEGFNHESLLLPWKAVLLLFPIYR